MFDTVQGADDANVTPTQFSGGSRVIQYGLVSLRQMATLATVFYVAAGADRAGPAGHPRVAALLVIGVVGFIVVLGYTAPPLKFVYRGLGEIAVAIGFGPLMLLGAYVVQTRGALAWEPFVGVDPDRAAGRADPVRQRDPRSARRRAGRQADAARPVLAAGGHRRLQHRGRRRLRGGRGRGRRGRAADPGAADAADHPARPARVGGLAPNYDNPYGLMAFMGVNIQLHLAAGALLLVAYLIVLAVGALAPGVDLFVG